MKLIILDRDGVINYDSKHYIKSKDEWLAIPGSLEAIVKLKQKGYKIAVATNQSGIARELYTKETLEEIHAEMQRQLNNIGGEIDLFCYCPHHPKAGCDCRKPRVGMLKTIQNYFECDIKQAYFVGDSISDIKAAITMQCQPILVETGNGTLTYKKLKNKIAVPIYKNLYHFVNNL